VAGCHFRSFQVGVVGALSTRQSVNLVGGVCGQGCGFEGSFCGIGLSVLGERGQALG